MGRSAFNLDESRNFSTWVCLIYFFAMSLAVTMPPWVKLRRISSSVYILLKSIRRNLATTGRSTWMTGRFKLRWCGVSYVLIASTVFRYSLFASFRRFCWVFQRSKSLSLDFSLLVILRPSLLLSVVLSVSVMYEESRLEIKILSASNSFYLTIFMVGQHVGLIFGTIGFFTSLSFYLYCWFFFWNLVLNCALMIVFFRSANDGLLSTRESVNSLNGVNISYDSYIYFRVPLRLSSDSS